MELNSDLRPYLEMKSLNIIFHYMEPISQSFQNDIS